MSGPSIGVDVEEVKRIQSLVRSRRFLTRIFSPQEISYCSTKKNKAQHYAVRFAAKEAIWKALSETLTRKKITLSHKDIAIKNTPRGKPLVQLPKKLARYQKKLVISLSHTRSYAVAVAYLNG